MPKSNQSTTRSKANNRPPKPYPEFPLTPHPLGYCCKTIRSKLHYFGRWGKMVDGVMVRLPDDGWQKALDKFTEERDDLYAGREPRKKTEGLTVMDLCNRYLSVKDDLLTTGEMVPRTFATYKKTTDQIISVIGKHRLISDLTVDDFGKLRKQLAQKRGPVALGHAIQCVRMVFKFAYDEGLIDAPVRYGQQFNKPNKKTLRKHRASNGKKMFEADEIRQILGAAPQPLKAMILLAINCGFGQSDLSSIPQTAVKLQKGWIDYPRPKTGVHRRCPLWPETLSAVRDAIENRPNPKSEDDADLVFITKYGQRWVKSDSGSSDDAVTKQFATLLKELSLYRRGRGFYALRHTFQTIGEEAGETACKHIMGHIDTSMSAVYREQISDMRLQAVTNHVRDWLFLTGAELVELKI